MIVRESDPAGRKWKYWFLELLLELCVLAVCLGIPVLICLKSDHRLFGAVLFFLMFYVGEKINCAIENHIGIAMSNWNPRRAYLIQWPPGMLPPWLRPKSSSPPEVPGPSPRGGRKKKKRRAGSRSRF